MGACIGWKNHFTQYSSRFIATPSNGGGYAAAAWDATSAAVNAIDTDPSKVARLDFTRSGASTYILPYFQFGTGSGQQQTCRTYGVFNMRIPASVTAVHLALYDHAGANQYQTEYVAADLVPIPGTIDRYNLVGVSSVDITALALGVFIYCPISITDYIEFGHVWTSPALFFDEGALPDWKHGVVDPSEVERARGGALVANQLPRRRKLTCGFDSISYAAAMGTPGTPGTLNYRQFMHEAGNSTPCVVLPRTPIDPGGPTQEELHYLQTQGLYSSFVGQHEIGHAGGNLFRSSGVFEEIR